MHATARAGHVRIVYPCAYHWRSRGVLRDIRVRVTLGAEPDLAVTRLRVPRCGRPRQDR